MGANLREIIQSRWYMLAIFVVTCTSGFLWYAFPSVSWWPLLPILLLIVFQVIGAGKVSQKFNPLITLALFVFLFTAGVGVCTAYNQQAALDKFRILVGAVLLFLAIAIQPRRNLWIVLAIFGLVGSLFAIYFSLTYDWRANSVDTAIINRIGEYWMGIRYSLPLPSVIDDIAGGVFAILLPLQVALWLYAHKERRMALIIYSTITWLLIAGGLFITGLRAAWGALAAGFCISIALILAQRLLSRYSGRVFRNVAVALLLSMVAGGVLFIGVLSGELFPGVQETAIYWAVRSRFSLFRDVFDLTGDFLLIGGGLASFPGLFSRYILSIFDYYLAYSHNLYLDLIIEQGIFGLLAFMTILLFGLWHVVMHRFKAIQKFDASDFLMGGVMLGLITMTLQGLVENSLHGMRGTPFLLLLPALAFAAAKQDNRVDLGDVISPGYLSKKLKLVSGGLAFLSVLIVLVIFHRPIIAQWYANIGSIAMAKVELEDWPDARPNIESFGEDALSLPIHFFNQALEYDSNNRSANYRLGRIAMEKREYPAAIDYLQRAFEQDQHYHGIRKNLGYSYVFDGQIDVARLILVGIPEATSDMTVYNWWWGTQGRDDLATYAIEYVHSDSQK
jgi:tetratricopeptide (TPR) repeat protein